MKIGIIGPSKLKNERLFYDIAEIVAKLGHEIVVTADKGSSSELFARKYLEFGGKKVYSVIPLDDKEFGNSWVERIGGIINCRSWRNQPEKLNEECDALVSLGYSTGGMIEICYSKWFNKKPVYILKEFIDSELPKELEESLDLKYLTIDELEEILK